MHDHARHPHAPEETSDGRLLLALAANMGLTVFEVIAGLLSGSLALLADALHNFNDAAALGISYAARKLSRRRADSTFTFGYRRAELVGALINLTALLIIGLYLAGEAVGRLFDPQPVEGAWMMAAAGVALAVDLWTVFYLRTMAAGSLNVKAAFLHHLTDALASVAVLAGGLVVYLGGWSGLDALLTLGLAGFVLWGAGGMLVRTAKILMNAAPEGLDPGRIHASVRELPGVADLHHIHLWEIAEGRVSLEAHVVLEEASESDWEAVRDRVRTHLQEHFHIDHVTLELERAGACGGHESHAAHAH